MLPHFSAYAQIHAWNPACLVNGVPTLKCLEDVAGNVIFASSSIVVFILFIMFIVGGFSYLTSGGNPEKIKKAQGTLKFAIIGFVLFLSAFLILKAIDILFLGGNTTFFNFTLP